jgi:hypothetical protein
MNKELKAIKNELELKSEREATKLFRLAWRAVAHGCKPETVAKIREEARWLHESGTAYPERLIAWDFEYKFRYAFKF